MKVDVISFYLIEFNTNIRYEGEFVCLLRSNALTTQPVIMIHRPNRRIHRAKVGTYVLTKNKETIISSHLINLQEVQ